MKKVISLLLVVACCLSLCACGGTKLTKEEMLATATTLWHEDYRSEYKNNPEEAEKNYVGKIVKFVATVKEINAEDNKIEIYAINRDYESYAISRLFVCLSPEEISLLSVDDKIGIVGEITSLIIDGNICMDNAYTYPVEECIADQIPAMIELFGKGDGDKYVDRDESTAFFKMFKEDFYLMTGEDIKEKIIGTWFVKDTFGAEFEYTFNSDGTSITTYNGKEEACTWVLKGDYMYLDLNGGEVNTNRAIKLEVRQLNENSVMLYEDDFGEYNGQKYKMDSTCAVLVKK